MSEGDGFIIVPGSHQDSDSSKEVKEKISNFSRHVTFGQSTYVAQDNADVDQVLEEIAAFDVSSVSTLLIETIVTAQNLDQYAVKGQVSGGTAHILYDEATDFTTPETNGLILMAYKFTTSTGAAAADNDLTTTAALESALLKLDVRNYNTISILAACAANNGSVTTHGSAQ